MPVAAKNGKSWARTFLTPGWVIAALLIITFSYFAFTFLAPWQLGKNERLEQRNEHIVEAFEHDPVPVTTKLGPGGTLEAENEWSRVTATGRFLPEDEVLLRLRPVDRVPAFQVLTPFALTSGETIVVNRGWVPAVDSTKVPEFDAAPAGEVTIRGMLLADEGVHPTTPNIDQGRQMVYSISPNQIGELTGIDVVAPYIQLTSDSAGVLTAIPLPQLETGNHLSYGLQWIAFGLLAPAGLIYFIAAETRERRRYRDEQDELAALTADTVATEPAEPAAAGSAEPAPAPAPARSRYGHTRRNHWAEDDDQRV